jgi:predicted nucleic acid-binding protein
VGAVIPRTPTGVVPTTRLPTGVVPTTRLPTDVVPPGVPILLDSSALLSYLDGSEPVSPIATTILDGWVRSGRNDGLVSAVSVMEVLVRPIAAGDSAHRAVVGFLYGFPNLRLVALDAIAGQLAASLRAHGGFSSVDSLVVASGLAVGARHLVTNDASWRPRLREGWPEVTVLTLSELAAR